MPSSHWSLLTPAQQPPFSLTYASPLALFFPGPVSHSFQFNLSLENVSHPTTTTTIALSEESPQMQSGLAAPLWEVLSDLASC